MSKKSPDRRSLAEIVRVSGRDMTAQGVMYYTKVAGRFGLSVSDWRAWDLLQRYGPMTAGDFTKLTGLTPGGVTALVDRLVAAGAVARRQDPGDGRRVIIAAVDGRTAEAAAEINASLQAALSAVYGRYSDAELEAIGRFLGDVTRAIRAETDRLERAPTRRPAAGRKRAGRKAKITPARRAPKIPASAE
ncbi:MAG: MarR family transcriptional regulator [Rhodospirillaceae bacterium]|nr:MarR family transcriptional regulator [Rhodospirillaceae bacterium]